MAAHSMGVRRVDAVQTNVGQVYTGGMYGTSGMETGYGQSSGLVVRNDTADLNGDGITTGNEAMRFAGGERRVDMVGGGNMIGGGMQTSANLVVRNDTNDL